MHAGEGRLSKERLLCAMRHVLQGARINHRVRQVRFSIFLEGAPTSATATRNAEVYKKEPDDEAKAVYIKEALTIPVDFECAKPLDQDLLDAFAWVKGKSPQERMERREHIICAIERCGEQIKAQELDRAW